MFIEFEVINKILLFQGYGDDYLMKSFQVKKFTESFLEKDKEKNTY